MNQLVKAIVNPTQRDEDFNNAAYWRLAEYYKNHSKKECEKASRAFKVYLSNYLYDIDLAWTIVKKKEKFDLNDELYNNQFKNLSNELVFTKSFVNERNKTKQLLQIIYIHIPKTGGSLVGQKIKTCMRYWDKILKAENAKADCRVKRSKQNLCEWNLTSNYQIKAINLILQDAKRTNSLGFFLMPHGSQWDRIEGCKEKDNKIKKVAIIRDASERLRSAIRYYRKIGKSNKDIMQLMKNDKFMDNSIYRYLANDYEGRIEDISQFKVNKSVEGIDILLKSMETCDYHNDLLTIFLSSVYAPNIISKKRLNITKNSTQIEEGNGNLMECRLFNKAQEMKLTMIDEKLIKHAEKRNVFKTSERGLYDLYSQYKSKEIHPWTLVLKFDEEDPLSTCSEWRLYETSDLLNRKVIDEINYFLCNK